jgi:hypothetical protein
MNNKESKKNNNNLVLFIPNMLNWVKKAPWLLGRHAFVIVLMLIMLDLIFGAVVFYKYIFLVEASQSEITQNYSGFKKDTYQEILKIWETRDQRVSSIE